MNIKSIIKQSDYGKLLVLYSHEIRNKVNLALFSDEAQINRAYRKFTGQLPNLKNPQTFSEKLQVYKLKKHDPLMTQCADKYAVRDYISSCKLDSILNEIYAVYDSVDQIDPDQLPDRFVLKAAHGSGFNLIVKDKSKINWRLWKKIMRSWLRQDIYWSGREWAYKNIPRRIIAERYLEDPSGELRDYKFYCFHGVPKLMHMDIGRFSGKHLRNFYDMDRNLLPLRATYEPDPSVPCIDSEAFGEMKRIAERISRPFSFCRVDLYACENVFYFGEITFYPDSGNDVYEPEEYNRLMGSWWDIGDCVEAEET